MDYDQKSITVLHWNYRGFTEFPIDYMKGEEEEVTDIYLKENLISRVPNDIGKLLNLESLYLSGNDISELPREISKLQSLKCLDVSGNRLRYIPDEIGEVRRLKFLILDENELRTLPLRISELRALRYLSVCDNKLEWLPQRPVYNYHHCEFKFWRNSNLKTIPYSLWYHMFRGQQTRSLNIGCLTLPCQDNLQSGICRFKICQDSREWQMDVGCSAQYNHVLDYEVQSPPSLLELCKRVFYQIMYDSASKLTTNPMSIYSDRKRYCLEDDNNQNDSNIINLEKYLNDVGLSKDVENCTECDLNGNKVNIITKRRSNILIPDIKKMEKRKDYCVVADIINVYFDYLPHFMKTEFSNGPLTRCENSYCRKPIFDYVLYEFCLEKITLIDSSEDVILNAAFCSKSCADVWKLGKATILYWKKIK